jgi:hypothetical protein
MHHALKTYGGVEVQVYTFLTSAPENSHFTLREIAVGIHCIGGRVDPRAGLDAVAKRRKLTAPAGNRTPVVQPGECYLMRV